MGVVLVDRAETATHTTTEQADGKFGHADANRRTGTHHVRAEVRSDCILQREVLTCEKGTER